MSLKGFRLRAEGSEAGKTEGILPVPEPEPEFASPVDLALWQGMRQGASDVELVEGAPPIFRLHRRMVPQPDLPPVSREDLEGLLSEEQRRRLEEERDIDFSYSLPGLGRFRANVYYDRNGLVGVFRVIPNRIPDLSELGLPDSLRSLTEARSGLILVTGPTGSGKSTTLASLIRNINETRAVKIVTIEDPVEYLHEPIKARISQRQVGVDVVDFHRGLRAALRQAPDVILVGEMRDRESIEMALTAAETGHLVLSTLHTRAADEAAQRVVDAFPEDARPAVRSQLSAVLQAVIAQQLLPRRDGKGLVLAYEVMVATTAVRAAIRDGKFQDLRNSIDTGSSVGMISMNRTLAQLVKDGVIEQGVALAHSPDEKQLLQFLSLR